MKETQLGSVFQVGKDHLKREELCQDRAVAIEKDGLKIIILSDGMDLIIYADLGAIFVIDYILKKANDIYKLLNGISFDEAKEIIWAEPDEEKIFAQSFNSLLLQMETEAGEYAKRIGANIDDLESNLSFVIVGVDKVISVAIGDSPIWIKRKSKEWIDVLDGNEGAKEVTFSTMSMKLALQYNTAMDIFPANDLQAVLIMSEGCFGNNKKKLYDTSDVDDFPKWFYDVIKGKRSIQKTVDQLVKVGYDDCSFAYYVDDVDGIQRIGNDNTANDE